MESFMESIWYVAAYAQCIGGIALLGFLIAIMYQAIRDKVRAGGVTTSVAGHEPIAPSATTDSW